MQYCVMYLTYFSVSEPFGQNRREPIYLAGFLEESPPACSLHVAPGQHLPPAIGSLLFGAAWNREGY